MRGNRPKLNRLYVNMREEKRGMSNERWIYQLSPEASRLQAVIDGKKL